MLSAVIYVLLARHLHLSAGLIGLLTSAGAVGGLIGALITSRLTARAGQGPSILWSIVVVAPCGLVAPFVQDNWSLGLYAGVQALMMAAIVVYNVTQVSFRQGLCPDRLLGRMNATMRFLVWGTLPLGALVGGVLGEAIGVRPTLLICGIGGFLPILPVALSKLPTIKELPSLGTQ